jgi:peptidoglycan/LPS O-acetylase OafA/YrhL
MFLYSGKGINDLGLYFQCRDVDGAEYFIFEVQKSPAVVIGLCVPDTCTVSDFWALLSGNATSPLTETLMSYTNPLVQSNNPNFAESHRRLASGSDIFRRITKPSRHVYGIQDFTASAILMFVFCILLLLLGIIGTATEFAVISMRSESMITLDSSGESSVNSEKDRQSLTSFDGALKEKEKPKYIRILMCFSLYTNATKLFAVKDEKKKEPLDCLNFIRVVSICWVIFGHTHLYRLDSSVVLNVDKVPILLRHFNFTTVLSGPYSVDTFFWLSGVLQGYLMTMQIAAHKKINWIMIVVHRFIRILPLYMFIMLFQWSMTKYMGNGPKWYNNEELMHSDCADYFWTYPLFINNFVLPSGTNRCMPVAWYLPNDMQFFIVSLPIMYLYVRHSRIFGWALLLMGIGFSIISNASISYNEHLHANLSHPENDKLMHDLYIKPYNRVAPYFIGLLTGFIYYSYKKKKTGEEFDALAAAIAESINNSRIVRFIMYGLGLFFINFFIFILYDSYESYDNWSNSQNAAYYAFQKLAWGLGLSLFFLPIFLGHMTFLRSFMQSNWWMPAAKLVFAVYLFHLVVGQIYFQSQPVTYYWNTLNATMDSIVVAGLTFLLVIPITLFVEAPMINLEKILLHGK